MPGAPYATRDLEQMKLWLSAVSWDSAAQVHDIMHVMQKVLTNMPISLAALPIHSASEAFGLTSGPIFLENLACDGTEAGISDCPQSGVPGLHECDHSQDAGVQCLGA